MVFFEKKIFNYPQKKFSKKCGIFMARLNIIDKELFLTLFLEAHKITNEEMERTFGVIGE